ncbi:MAG: cysteine hydrolase [Rhodocyclaceae bacterium]
MSDTLRFGRLVPHRTAHLCIDMQRLFAQGSPWHAPWLERVLPRVVMLARQHPDRNVFTRFMPPMHAGDLPGSWRHYYEKWPQVTLAHLPRHMLDLVAPLDELAKVGHVIDKSFYSPFHGTALRAWLQAHEVDSLIISGTETDVCVAAAVSTAVDYGYRVVLASDAVCSSADASHDAQMTLYRTRLSQQIEVAEVADILAQW